MGLSYLRPMTVEAGWYYAEGDPPGTVRRWNGNAWVGFPIEAPREQQSASTNDLSQVNDINTRRFKPVPGQVGLKPFARLAQFLLVAVAIANLIVAASVVQLVPYAGAVTGFDESGLDSVPDDLATRFALSTLASAVLTLFAGLAFVTWFFLAYRNVSLWTRTKRSPAWAIFAWVVPFISFTRPMTMMLELVETSASRDREENPSPLPVVFWWLLWQVAGFAMIFFIGGIDDVEQLASRLLVMQGITLTFGVIAAGLAVWIVQSVTEAQDNRRRPTPAQLELMRQDAELEAFKRSQSSGIAYGG